MAWAASNGRIPLTRDRATMPDFAYDRLIEEPMAGIFVIRDRMPIRQTIDELSLLIECSAQTEWRVIALYLPL
ncbi:MAG: hypothetical protein ACFB4J_12995 [Elainellaceae cyanobacterium]